MSGTLHYLDHAASAPRRDEVAEAMAPWEHGVVGNPSGSHQAARRARQAIEDARDVVAEFVGQPTEEVIFTAGGTESCYLALSGVVRAHRKTHAVSEIVTSPTEHHAVLSAAQSLAAEYDDVKVVYLDVDEHGVIVSDSLWDAAGENTAIVSVMTANNETGVFQPTPIVAALAAGAVPGGGVSHTDAIAAAPWLYLPSVTDAIDLVSICAHKIGGPVNAGALVLRRQVPFEAAVPGGGQERGHRGGTVDVAAAVGLAAACRATLRDLSQNVEKVSALAERLTNALAFLPGLEVTARYTAKLPGTVHVTVQDAASDELLFLLDRAGVCASAGASCSSGASVTSHVLDAMGIPVNRSRGAVRFSLGPENTVDDVDAAINAMTDAVYRIRGERK